MKISTKIFLAFSFILLLFLLVTIVNLKLSQEVNKNSTWVSNSQTVIRNSNRLQKGIIDMENAVRGYLLSGNETFLDPYNSGLKEVSSIFGELSSQIRGNSNQMKNLDTIRHLHRIWLKDFANPLIVAKRNVGKSSEDNQKFAQLFRIELNEKIGKSISDDIREKFAQFNSWEYKLRKERSEKLQQSLQVTSIVSKISIIVSILIGFGYAYYISKIISRRIGYMVGMAEKISKGNFRISITDNNKDELTHLAKSLNVMAQKLDASFTELDQFAYVVSHDLKAPLRGITNVTKWLEEDKGKEMPDYMYDYIDIIRGRVQRMENLIEGILKLSRISKVKIEKKKINVNELVRGIIELLCPPSNFNFHVSKLPDVYTVELYMQQLFLNLISNAIKYNDKPNAEVYIGCNEFSDYYEFYVADNGPGIAKEYHEKIFVVFQTLQERDAFESTGVGLSIVKKILQSVKGEITLESEINKGSKFIFKWPKKTFVEEINYN